MKNPKRKKFNNSKFKKDLKLNKELSLDEEIYNKTQKNLDNQFDSSISSRRNNKKFKKGKNKKKFCKIVFTFIFILIIFSIILISISSRNWKELASKMINNENSIILDTSGNTIATLGSERISKNISISNLPDYFKNAYIAIEDKRFYNHSGIDIRRTTSAIFSYVVNAGSSSFGGSTITQQLVKNLTGDNSNSVSRKVKEWLKAYQLEQILTKDEILEAYLNIIYIGPNIYGVEMGSLYYFNKSSSELNLAEAAFMAGISNTPNSYNPFKNLDNLEKIKNRTKTVLNAMKEQNYISEEDYQNAVIEVDNGLHFSQGAIQASGNGIYSYHTDATISEVITDIADKKHITKTFATNYLYMAGLKIYSTQDSNVQLNLENEFEKNKYILHSTSNPNTTSQAAMVIINHSNGQVLGCIGSLGKKTTARGFNRATQAIRQTGSSSKPLAVLVPAIDKKIITATSIFDDNLTEFYNGENEESYSPINYNGYLGNITIRRAIESSQNIPFVKILKELTPQTSIKYMKKMGITTLNEKDNNLSLALGGLDKGISPLEMAGGYATIANDGIYIEPTFYTLVTDSNGETFIKSKQKIRKVFSEDVAFIIKELLTQPVNGNEGTATYCKINGIDVAAKTGSTNGNFDKWLCGFTNYYTAVTWYGFDLNETINFESKNPAGLLWSNVMKLIHSNLDNSIFEMPNDVISEKICPSSGKLATSNCTDSYVEYFLVWTEPKEYCDQH